MSDAAYLVVGVCAFLVSLGIQLAGYVRLLRPALRGDDVEARKAALKRWAIFLVSWQVLVLAAIAAYAVPLASSHPAGYAWVAPVIGAILGTALPLQLAVAGLSRSALR